MKLLITGDLHLRTSAPQGRVDDFFETQMKKLRFCTDVYYEQGCSYWLQPGDFFDTARPSFFLVRKVLALLKNSGVQVLTIPGQHDYVLGNTDSLGRSALGLLHEARVLEVLLPGQVLFLQGSDIAVQGAWFGHDIPKPCGEISILVAHVSVGTVPLFPGHDLQQPEDFLRKHPFDVAIVGDYHYDFTYVSSEGRMVINAGCLVRLRNTSKDREHHPKVVVLDTDKIKDDPEEAVRSFIAPHEPADAVFSVLSKGDERNFPEVELFVEAIKKGNREGASFLELLERFLRKHKVEAEVEDKIYEVLNSAEESGS